MTGTIEQTALKRMRAAIGAVERSESPYRTYIEACAAEAEAMVTEALGTLTDSLLAAQVRAIYVAFGEQVRKHGGKDVPGSSMPNGTNDRRYVVLGEEFGEVGNALNELSLIESGGAFKRDIMGKPSRDWQAELRKELVDVATVAVAWLYWLDVEAAEAQA